jgi:peptidoglycan DL-endopeptidase CwlO
MTVQSISTTTSSIASTPAASPTASTAAETATTTQTAATDTVTLSEVSQTKFANILHELSNQLNAYGHEVTWDTDNNAAVTSPDGTTASKTVSTSKAIAAGYQTIETTAENQLTSLTPDQQSQLDTANQKIATQLNKFQTFIANRASGEAHAANKYNAAIDELKNQLNAFGHQVTWDIDHGATPTGPSETSSSTDATSTAASTDSTSTSATATATTTTATTPTTAQTIADGYATLEAAATKRLGHLSVQQKVQLAQLEQNLSTEQTSFTSFIARRSAYKAAHETTGTAKDLTA